MSIVAGCSLFDGVMLLADCRATIIRNQSYHYVDSVQKLFALTKSMAIGFAGNISVAGSLLLGILTALRQFKSPRHLHPFILIPWISRFMRYAFVQYATSPESQIHFIIAAVVRSRRNVVRRKKVVDIMDRIRLGQAVFQRNWIPEILVKILTTKTEFTILEDIPLSILCVLNSPDFEPRYYEPLEFTAIGSGKGCKFSIDRHADFIFAGDVGNSFVESLTVRDAVTRHLEENSIPSVGGLMPVIKVSGRGIEFLGQRVEIPVGGERIELRVDEKRQIWTQVHVNSGTAIRLLPPWNFSATGIRRDAKFDFLPDAFRRFRVSE